MSNPRAIDPATQLVEPQDAFPAEASHGPLVEVPTAFVKKADELITHYPVSKRSASLPLLHLWQETFGYVSPQGIEWIAAKLELQPINILELVTFYPMFRQHPIGRIQVKVCRTLSCALAGSYALCDHFRKACGTDEPDAHGIASSPDGKYAVEFVECIASCGTAPVIMINDDSHESVTPQRADELLQQYS
jgi:NADH-quinone oxidoreductase subunit E